MRETIKYGGSNIVHLMIAVCCEEQSPFQDPSYLSSLEKSSLS